LKYFSKQLLSSEEQKNGLQRCYVMPLKLYTKNGKQNVVANALSRKEDTKGLLSAISIPQFDWMEEAMI
jgi:hypothetical protein